MTRLLDTWGAANELSWANGEPYGYWDATTNDYAVQAGAPYPAQVMSYSRGNPEVADDGLESEGWDSYVDGLGVTAAIAAGNDGPAPGSINEPADAYNVIAVGGFCCGANATDRSADSVFSWSSEGPTLGGRKKPDLVAAGSADVADSLFNTDGSLWRYATGTSFAAPQVAGAATLLAGAGITDPRIVKAILIDSARPGRATPGSSMGTQTAWEPDWGWGELDLTDAFAEHLNYAADAVPANGVRFYRATAGAPGDRATLVWDRRVTPCFHAGCAYQPHPESSWQVFTLSDLALSELDPSSGAVEAASNSQVDNVQQVRAVAAGPVVYKVSAGDVDGLSAEPFALAARNALTPLATPQPTVSVATNAASYVRAGAPVTLTARISNPSPDLTAEAASASLELPPGVGITAGPRTEPLGTLGTRGSGDDTRTVTWTVTGTTDGLKRLTAATTASRYGSMFTSSAGASFTVDATAPSASIGAPSGTAANTSVPVAWGATDGGSGVASFDVDVAIDSGPLQPWLVGTSQTAATYAGAAGHTYQFAVRATDRVGNVGELVLSGPVTIAPPPGAGTGRPTGGTQSSSLRDAHLRVKHVRRAGSMLVLTGTLASGVRAAMRITWFAGHRRVGSARARAVHGRFTVRLRIPAGTRSISIVIAFPGDPRFGRSTRRLAVRTH